MDDINNLINNKFELGNVEKFAVIIGANPSKTARSPILWNAAFKANKLNFSMLPLDVEKNKLKSVFEVLKEMKNFIGGSVTVPYKNDLAEILGKDLSPEAKNIGAINCIYKNDKNKFVGTNTDGEASVASFKKKFGEINVKNILILGAGGAGKAVANYFAQELTSGKLYVSTRNYESMKNLHKLKNISFVDWKEKEKILEKINILINCTSIGFDIQFEHSPFSREDLSLLKKDSIVYDIIYNPLKTRLLKYSEELGLKIFNGLEMNVLQAVIAFNYVVKINNNIAENAMRKI